MVLSMIYRSDIALTQSNGVMRKDDNVESHRAT